MLGWTLGNLTCGDLEILTCLEKRASVIKCEWFFDLVRERDRKPSFDIFVVCGTLILSGGWWHGISSFFLILLEGRGGGEVSSRLGWLFCFVLFWFISSFRFCVCSVYLVDELVPVFLVLLKEVRMLR